MSNANPPDANFGSRLRFIIWAMGWSESQFARMCGIAQTQMSHYLCGRREPDLPNLAKILSSLPKGIDIRRLITGK